MRLRTSLVRLDYASKTGDQKHIDLFTMMTKCYRSNGQFCWILCERQEHEKSSRGRKTTKYVYGARGLLAVRVKLFAGHV